MSEDTAGGMVGPAVGAITLDDAECILSPIYWQCIRDDDRHNYELHDVRRLCDVEPQLVRVRCLHRPCHVVPVESAVDGALLARLCRSCDAQLPA